MKSWPERRKSTGAVPRRMRTEPMQKQKPKSLASEAKSTGTTPQRMQHAHSLEASIRASIAVRKLNSSAEFVGSVERRVETARFQQKGGQNTREGEEMGRKLRGGHFKKCMKFQCVPRWIPASGHIAMISLSSTLISQKNIRYRTARPLAEMDLSKCGS